MALDLSKMDKPYFSYDFDNIGRVQFFYTTLSVKLKIYQYSENSDPEPADIVRMFICETGCKSEDSDIKKCAEGQDVSWEEAQDMSEEELDRFSEEFIEKDDSSGQENNVVIGQDRIEIQREEGEQAHVFISRAIIAKARETKEVMEKSSKPYDNILNSLSNPPIELQKAMENASRFSQMIDSKFDSILESRDFPREAPHIDFEAIKNPVFDTNEKIEELISQIKDQNDVSLSLLQYIKQMNDGVLTLSSELNKHANESFNKSDKMLKRSTGMLVVAVVTMILTFAVLAYNAFGPVKNKDILTDIHQSTDEIVNVLENDSSKDRSSSEKLPDSEKKK